MRNFFIALIFFVTVNSEPTYIPTFSNVLPEIPAYAKWGTLAIKETQSKYPKATIIDYLHEGSESKGDSTIEKFKLWLKVDDNEFGVFVRIEYTTETEEVIAIEFEETSK